MNRREALMAVMSSGFLMDARPAAADGSNGELAAYYDRNLALINGVVYDWTGGAAPSRAREGVVQVGVGRDAYALLDNGDLVTWSAAAERAARLRRHVASFAAGRSGWCAIDHNRTLWNGTGRAEPRRVADGVIAACIGDGADYYITQDGALFVRGLAHRGQYGDGRLQESKDFVTTAREAVVVRAHTGHALYLSRNGDVFGSGGNRYGPLSSHGLGDKADRWGRIFEGAVGIATGRAIHWQSAPIGHCGPGDRVSVSSPASCSTGSPPRRLVTPLPSPSPSTERSGNGIKGTGRGNSCCAEPVGRARPRRHPLSDAARVKVLATARLLRS